MNSSSFSWMWRTRTVKTRFELRIASENWGPSRKIIINYVLIGFVSGGFMWKLCRQRNSKNRNILKLIFFWKNWKFRDDIKIKIKKKLLGRTSRHSRTKPKNPTAKIPWHHHLLNSSANVTRLPVSSWTFLSSSSLNSSDCGTFVKWFVGFENKTFMAHLILL